ncbi:hypothetical protein [Pseudoalteromonas galatheae]|uniref:hypothetical protein n=1 Tax=Pseudoalteromonas galatheae TaxID=579562 RepID=UPI001433448E|nr:hypothetical protein [Pseudoalteromonas galatheae]
MLSTLPSGSFGVLPSVLGLPFRIMITAQAAGESIEVADMVIMRFGEGKQHSDASLCC